jgi:hypothetical protein
MEIDKNKRTTAIDLIELTIRGRHLPSLLTIEQQHQEHEYFNKVFVY